MGRASSVPEQLLPLQFAARPRRSAEGTPELRLLTALLEDGIRTFCRCGGAPGTRSRHLFHEAADWIDSSDVS